MRVIPATQLPREHNNVKILFCEFFVWLFLGVHLFGNGGGMKSLNVQKEAVTLKYVHMNPIVKQKATDCGVTHVLTHKGDCFSLPNRITRELKEAGYIAKYICYATNDRNHWGLIPIVQFWSSNKC